MKSTTNTTFKFSVNDPDVIKMLRVYIAHDMSYAAICSILKGMFQPNNISDVDILAAMGREALRVVNQVNSVPSRDPGKQGRINDLARALEEDFKCENVPNNPSISQVQNPTPGGNEITDSRQP